MINRILIGLSLFVLTGCSTTLPYSVIADDAWFLEDGRAGFRFPMFCMANKQNQVAHPVCTQATKVKTSD